MSKLRITSDLHLDHYKDYKDVQKHILRALPEIDGERDTNLIIAGDLFSPGFKHYVPVLNMLTQRFKRVILVAGNHDYWDSTLDEAPEWFDSLQDDYPNFFYLENDTVRLDDEVVIAGCTLWVDYNKGSELEMYYSERFMNDHRATRVFTSSEEFYKRHKESRAFLESLHKDGLTTDARLVVVTHHGPNVGSVANVYKDSKYNHLYYSDLTDVIKEIEPWYWIHGHTHIAQKYTVEDTEVIINPYGYSHEQSTERGYNPELILEI